MLKPAKANDISYLVNLIRSACATGKVRFQVEVDYDSPEQVLRMKELMGQLTEEEMKHVDFVGERTVAHH